MSGSLAPDIEVLAVQYPGRQERLREKPLDTVEELVRGVREALGDWTDRPMALFGHSMGATIAFETAIRLAADGISPLALFLSARRAPCRDRVETVHLLDDDGLLAEVARLGGTDPHLLGNEKLRDLILPGLRSDYKAIETYRGLPDAKVHCPIVALAGDEDPKATVDEVRGWAAHTTAAFELRAFPGGHFYLNAHAGTILKLISARTGQLAAGLSRP